MLQATFGKLTVVDLAGSERVKRSGVTGQGLKEAANINTSLLAFGNVVQVRLIVCTVPTPCVRIHDVYDSILSVLLPGYNSPFLPFQKRQHDGECMYVPQALADKKKHVPFRDSKLTRILEDSVGGNCKTSLLVCCSPAAESCGETLNALEFASRAMKVETTATLNECTVVVDAARLAADLAGEGIDEAVKAKAKEMQQLQQSMAAEKKVSPHHSHDEPALLRQVTVSKTHSAEHPSPCPHMSTSDLSRILSGCGGGGQAAAAAASKWQNAAKKAAEESAAKLAEQSELALKYKQQLQEVQRATAADQQALQERVKELEAMVQQAQEGHEAKARVVQLEADLATAQAALDDVRAEAAAAAEGAEVRPARLDPGRLLTLKRRKREERMAVLVVVTHH